MSSGLTNKQRLALKLSDQILELIDASSDMPRSDLQGCVEALATQLIEGAEEGYQDQIVVRWCIDDVLSVSPSLTPDQARDVLQQARRHHDASVGINWDVLEFWASEVAA